MHRLSASFVLGYHGCDAAVAERLLRNEPFLQSENTYDWLGSGVYFWEANPDRALEWASDSAARKASKGTVIDPTVVGAVIDLGFCLDLLSSNGIVAVEKAYLNYRAAMQEAGKHLPSNTGGRGGKVRTLDCEVLNYLHTTRKHGPSLQPFDTVRGLFTEGEAIYPGAGFRRQTHVQICVRNLAVIKGVFRVPEDHFSGF
jgi:hypothetical protein